MNQQTLITPSISNPHLGFYTVNGIPFYSKNEAAVFAQKVNCDFKWHFNDEIFRLYDWTVEPDESLDELYNQRARELRQKYDYLILSYSGGSDTHNVLMSFLRQGLFIDEILVNINDKINKIIVNDKNITDNWNYGAEYKLQIYPRLEEIRKQSPRTRISVVDTSDSILETFNGASDGSWIINKKEPLNVSAITRYNYLHFTDVRKRIDKEKSIAMIVGVEKPCVAIVQNKFFLVFTDRHANLTPIQQHFDEYTNTFTEFFYWHPDCTKMLAKQAHVVKKWLTDNANMRPLWTPDSRAEWFKNNRTHQKILKNVVYASTWNSEWFQAEKDTKFWYGEIDEWWHRYYSHTREYAIWKEGIKYMEKYASKFLTENNGVKDGMGIHFKWHFIGTMPEIQNSKFENNIIA
jgi:hypothetical protein